MNILGLVPARANSKRCPGKNSELLGEHTLTGWAVKAARESGICTEILCSTNDPSVIQICHDINCSVIERPEDLAQPDTPMIKVVRQVYKLMEPDIVILLQPTSPFRTGEDVREAYKILGNGDSVVSVTEPPDDLVFEMGFAYRLRPAPCMVVPNGAIYIITKDHLKRNGDWYNGLSYAYQMSKHASLDIDTPLDLEVARAIMASKAAA